MAWDNKTPTIVTTARLLNLPAGNVYEELKQYAAYQAESYFTQDDKLEEALLLRNDPLITLGLAQYGGSDKVALALYMRGSLTTGDPNYNKALRLAVLGNPLIPRQIMSNNTFGVVEDEEVLRFIISDDAKEELYTILRNPGAKKLLDKLYNQEKPFNQIPKDKFLRAVFWSHANPAVNDDESNEHGPDLDAWGIQKGIKRLVTTLPVTENGLRTAYWLLKSVDPRHVSSFDEDPTPVFKRWQPLQVGEDFKKHNEGDCWDLDLKEEFLCMLASFYGWYSAPTEDKKTKIIHLGSADSPDRILRCAHYAHAQLTPEQMQKGYDKDTDAFTVAALCNETLFWKAETRAKLEQFMRGRLIHRYRRRCEQIKKRKPEFDLRPVSEWGTSLLEDKVEQPSDEQKRLERLVAMAIATSKQLQRINKMLTWVLILVIAAVILIWRPHF
jgi:hypothetical protein